MAFFWKYIQKEKANNSDMNSNGKQEKRTNV